MAPKKAAKKAAPKKAAKKAAPKKAAPKKASSGQYRDKIYAKGIPPRGSKK